MRRLAVLTPVLLGLAFATAGCGALDFFKRKPITLTQGPSIGSSAPEIDCEDLDGKRFKLSDYRGKVVVVTFWASWCKYCIDRIPHEKSLVEKHRGKPFAFLGVNNDDDRADALRVVTARGVNWRNWHATGTKNPINESWKIKVWPTTYVIDANGVIRYTNVSGVHLDNAVESLLAEAPTRKQ